METLFILLADATITLLAMHLACKITDVNIETVWLIVAVMASAMVSFLPFGWFLSIGVLFWVLDRYSNARLWPDLVLMVIVSRGLSFLLLSILAV